MNLPISTILMNNFVNQNYLGKCKCCYLYRTLHKNLTSTYAWMAAGWDMKQLESTQPNLCVKHTGHEYLGIILPKNSK